MLQTKAQTQSKYGYKNASKTKSWFVIKFKMNETQWEVMIYSDYPWVDHHLTRVFDTEAEAQSYFDEAVTGFEKQYA